MTLSSLSIEYVRFEVVDEFAGTNPTTLTVLIAFPSRGDAPVSGDWKTATWETEAGKYYARTLVGTGGAVLAAGNYDVWVKLTDSPEVIQRNVGRLRIV